MLPHALAWLLLAVLGFETICATPTFNFTGQTTRFSVPLARKVDSASLSADEHAAWAFHERQSVRNKYGIKSKASKRATGMSSSIYPSLTFCR